MATPSKQSWAKVSNEPPTTVLDMAGACLDQSALDALVMMLREWPDRNSPVDIRIRNVSTLAVPKLTASFD
jgi:hypothetical protein